MKDLDSDLIPLLAALAEQTIVSKRAEYLLDPKPAKRYQLERLTKLHDWAQAEMKRAALEETHEPRSPYGQHHHQTSIHR